MRGHSFWKCEQVREEVRRGLWTARTIREMQLAATTIQLRWRAAKRMKFRAARRIQSQWRRYVHRHDLKELRRAKIAVELLVSERGRGAGARDCQ